MSYPLSAPTLSKAGLSDNLIIEQIRKNNQHFVLSTDQLIQLKTASVSERVIQVMIDPTATHDVDTREDDAGDREAGIGFSNPGKNR